MVLIKFVKVTFSYRIDKEPTVLEIPQYQFEKDIHKILSRMGVYKYNNTKVDLTIVNKINIEFFTDEVIY